MEADGTTLHKVNEITLQLFRLNEQPWKWGGAVKNGLQVWLPQKGIL